MTKCQICGEDANPNSVICSYDCADVRLHMFHLIDKYFPTDGCENCRGDLGIGCTPECTKQFRDGYRFSQDLWKLVRLMNHSR